MADALPQLAWQARPDGHIYWYNRRWYEYTGTTPAEMEGWGWQAVHDPAVLPAVMERWQQSVATGTPFDMVFPLRGADGTFRPFLTRVEPVRGADGRVAMWVGSNTDVSDQRRAEEVARESEARFRMVAEAVPQIVWVTRPDGFHEYYNPRWYEYTGMTEAESRGYGWSVPLHPDDRARSEARWKHSTDTGDPYEIEYRFRGADGAYRWFLGRALPQRDGTGAVVRWFGTCTDIDEFKRLRETLLTSEARYRHLTESIPQLVWTCRPDGWCDYLSRQWVEYTGVPMADQLGWAWVNVLHGDDRDRAAAAWQAAVEGRAGYDIEYRIRRHDGEYRWFRTRGGRVRGDDEAGGFWLGTCTDIHDQKERAAVLEAMVADRTSALSAQVEERRKAEEAVRKQRQFLDVILENVADGIVACDEGGTLTLFNRATREFHGLPAEPLPPDQWASHYSLFRADGVTPMPLDQLPLLRTLRGEVVRDAEMVIAPRGREARTLLASGQPLIDPDGRSLGAVVSMRDITERKRADEQFRRFAEELQRSNGELEKFAYVASHDLQEPLRKIQAFGDRLATRFGDKLDDQGRDYLDRMQASATRMRQLINDLLAFSRVTTKTQPFSRVDLNKAAADAVDDLHDRIQQTGGAVDVGPLPTIDADPTQVRQLLQNLIGNGLKFHKPGEPPRVTVRAETATEPGPGGPPRAVVRLTVSDNGIGFEEKYLDRIFQVFQRLHGRDEYDGTGVGLAICRKIVDRHGGAITARSAPGRGATFVVTLPLRHPTRATP